MSVVTVAASKGVRFHFFVFSVPDSMALDEMKPFELRFYLIKTPCEAFPFVTENTLLHEQN